MKENRVAIQESSRGWSDSVTPGMRIVIICGIGASDSVAFYTTVGVIERSGRPPLQIPGCRQPFSVGPVVASPLPHPRLLSEIATRFCDTPLFKPHCNPPDCDYIFHNPEDCVPAGLIQCLADNWVYVLCPYFARRRILCLAKRFAVSIPTSKRAQKKNE